MQGAEPDGSYILTPRSFFSTWSDDSAAESTGCLPEDQGSIPIIHRVVHHHLELQSQGIQPPHLSSLGTRHRLGAHGKHPYTLYM